MNARMPIGPVLSGLHERIYRQRVTPALNEGGLLPYMGRVFVLVWSGLRQEPSRRCRPTL